MMENQTPQQEESVPTQVTTPAQTNPVPKQETTPAQKNPKKVAAGRAGAAARKAKRERLLQELQEAKQSQLLFKEPEQDVEQLTKEPDPLPPSKQTDDNNQVNWIPLVVGSSCLLGAYLYTHRSILRPPQPEQTVNLQKETQLDIRDPFYME